MAWSDNYIGFKYKYGSFDRAEGTDCRTLITLMLKEVFQYDVDLEKDIPKDFFKKDADYMIKEAVKRGEIVKDINKIKKYDILFFHFDGDVRHMGMVIDDYKTFIHQMREGNSRLDKLIKPVWTDNFYCGVRVKAIHVGPKV